MSRAPRNLHATAVALGGEGVVIRGPSRSGKSALALALLRGAAQSGLEAALVADDQVLVRAEAGALVAEAPAAIRGLLEVSGVGIVRLPAGGPVPVRLVVDLAEPGALPRLPSEAEARIEFEGVTLRRIFLPARQAAHAANVILALLGGGEIVEPVLKHS